MTAAAPPASTRHGIRVYEPGHLGAARLTAYARDLWRWKAFTFELARSEIKAEHYATVFGQLWNLLHPILMAAVYYFLLTVIRGGDGADKDHVAKLVLGIFVFRFLSQAMTQGSRSVVTGERIILNSAVPRAVMPLASVASAAANLVPTLAVYLALHVALGQPVTIALAFLPVMVALTAFVATGLTLALAALTVAFRDTTNLLGHGTRYLMYVSPIIYRMEDVPDKIAAIIRLNPFTAIFAGLQEIVDGQVPTPYQFGVAALFALVALVAGFWYFVRKEPTFALSIS